MRKEKVKVEGRPSIISLTPARPMANNRADLSAVSSRVRESLYELHAHVDFVFRDTISRASNISSISKKTKIELEKLTLTTTDRINSSLAPFTCDIDDEANSSSDDRSKRSIKDLLGKRKQSYAARFKESRSRDR